MSSEEKSSDDSYVRVEKESSEQPESSQNLSERAQRVREQLNENGPTVDAVILKADGSMVQIRYNTSSNLKEVNKLLNGRPTVIGEIEDINVLIIRSISDSQNYRSSSAKPSEQKNKNILPHPFCNKSYDGDYLLYRVNENAVPIDLTLDEYTKYVDANKDKTEEAIKSYKAIEDQEITQHSESNLNVAILYSEVDQKVRKEFQSKYGREGSEAEITSSVKATMNRYIDAVIDDNSPMNDPDYDPREDEDEYAAKDELSPYEREKLNEALHEVIKLAANERQHLIERVKEKYKEENKEEITEDALQSAIEEAKELLATEEADEDQQSDESAEVEYNESDYDYSEEEPDENEWREKLDQALNYVRAKGRSDGERLAEMFADTYYELHGQEASLEELSEIFDYVQQELADEAEQEQQDESEEEEEEKEYDESEEEVEREQSENEEQEEEDEEQESPEMDDGSISYYQSRIGANLNEAEPNDVVEYSYRVVIQDMVNQARSRYAMIKGRNPTAQELQNSVSSITEKIIKECVDNYSSNNESEPRAQRQRTLAQREQAIGVDYDPNNAVDQQQAEQDEEENEEYEKEFEAEQENESEEDSEDEEEEEEHRERHSSKQVAQKMMQSKRVKSKLGRSETYGVYFSSFSKQREEKNLRAAIDSFKRRNKREPNEDEVEHIVSFLQTDRDQTVIEYKAFDSEEEEEDQQTDPEMVQSSVNQQSTPTKLLVTPIKEKKRSKRFTVFLDENESGSDLNKKEEQGLKWFKRFNNRDPSSEEIENIKRFIKADKLSAKACKFDVAIDAAMMDDQKDKEEDDETYKYITRHLTKKSRAERYELHFDDDDKRESGDAEEALKWFKRFNNRNPTQAEQDKIRAFIDADAEADDADTVDID